MKITSLAENISKCELKAAHGLSLYIETQRHKILFESPANNVLYDKNGRDNFSHEQNLGTVH